MEIVGMGSMLAICSIFDLWRKQIPIVVLALFGITGIGYQLFWGKLPLWDVITGVIVGVVLYIVSVFSQERIGKGDAMMMVDSGLYMGFWKNVTLLWMGSALAGVVCLLGYLWGKKGKNATVPFAPFLLVAYMTLHFMGGK